MFNLIVVAPNIIVFSIFGMVSGYGRGRDAKKAFDKNTLEIILLATLLSWVFSRERFTNWVIPLIVTCITSLLIVGTVYLGHKIGERNQTHL